MISTQSFRKDKLNEVLSIYPQLLREVLKLPVSIPYRLVGLYFLFGFLIIVIIPKKFMPKIDERKFVLNITLPSTSTLENTNFVVSEIEKFISSQKSVKNIVVNVGSAGEEKVSQIETLSSNQARIIVNLRKKGMSTQKFVSLVAEKIKEIPQQIEAEFITQQGLFGTGIGTGSDIVLEIKGKEIENLKSIAEKLVRYLNKNKNVMV
jgi:Cation/multidrug efflux pump